MKTILVPMDFSEEARYALQVAAKIAHKYDASILMAHVIETPGYFYLSDDKFADRINSEKQYKTQLYNYLNEKLEEIKGDQGLSGLQIEHKIEIGSTFPCLDRIGTENVAELVVLGSKGVGGMQELLLGSIAQRMIRFSNIPVLTVRNNVDTDKIKHVAFATNLKQTPHYVTNELKSLVQTLGAELHLLHVNTKNEWKPYREINDYIKDFAEQHYIKNYKVAIYDDVTALDGIMHYAKDMKVDMIALMTHGRTEYSHLVSGSISEQVASLSTQPVWTCTFDYNQLKWYDNINK